MDSDFCLDKERLMNSFMEEFNQNIQNNDISNDNIFKYTLLIGIRKYFRDFDSTNSKILQEQYLEKLQNTVDIFTSVLNELDDYKYEEHIQDLRDEYKKSSIKDDKEFSEILNDVLGINDTTLDRITKNIWIDL